MNNRTGIALSLSVVLSACGGGQSGALPPTSSPAATPAATGDGNIDADVQNTEDTASPTLPDSPLLADPLNSDEDSANAPDNGSDENPTATPLPAPVEIERPLTSTPPQAPELPPAAQLQLDEPGFMACIQTSLQFTHGVFGERFDTDVRDFYTLEQCSVSGNFIEQRTDTPGPAGDQTNRLLSYQACRNVAGVLDGEVSHSLTRPLSIDEERVEQRERYTVAYVSPVLNEHLESTVSSSDLFYIDTTTSANPVEWTSHQSLTRRYSGTLWHRTGLDELPLVVSNASGSYEVSMTLNSDEPVMTAVSASHTLVGCQDTTQANAPAHVETRISVNYDFPMRLIVDQQQVLSARIQLQAANGAVALLSSTDDPDTAEVVLYLDSSTPPITRNIEWAALLPTR